MEKDKVILALDTAAATGWALYANTTHYGTWKLGKKKHYNLAEHLRGVIEKHGVTEIIAEDIYKNLNKISAYKTLSKLHGVIELVAEEYNLPVTFYSCIDVRRYLFRAEITASLRGRKKFDVYDLTKADIQQKVESRFRHKTKTHDEADALALLHYHKQR